MLDETILGILSWLGIALTIIGFGVTINAALKAKKAAENAKDAAEKAVGVVQDNIKGLT